MFCPRRSTTAFSFSVGEVYLEFDCTGRGVLIRGDERKPLHECLNQVLFTSDSQVWKIYDKASAMSSPLPKLEYHAHYPSWAFLGKTVVVKAYLLDSAIPTNNVWWQLKDFLQPLDLLVEKVPVSKCVSNFLYSNFDSWLKDPLRYSVVKRSLYSEHLQVSVQIADRHLPEVTLSSAGVMLALGQKAALGRPATTRPNFLAMLRSFIKAQLQDDVFLINLIISPGAAPPPLGYPPRGAGKVELTVSNCEADLTPLSNWQDDRTRLVIQRMLPSRRNDPMPLELGLAELIVAGLRSQETWLALQVISEVSTAISGMRRPAAANVLICAFLAARGRLHAGSMLSTT